MMSCTSPTTEEVVMVPHILLSQEFGRLSPMTKRCPAGITVVGIGVDPRSCPSGGNQVSCRTLPLMSTVLPFDEIVSPGNPMTRFTRSGTGGPEHSPSSFAGLENTMMSPR